MVGSPIDGVTISVACPKCRKHSMKPLSQLVANNTVTCNHCAHVIDVGGEQWRAAIRRATDSLYKPKIKPRV